MQITTVENERVELAAQIGEFLCLPPLEDDDYNPQVLVDLARALCKDAKVKVRRALAEVVKSSPYLPQDIAERIARDVEDISVPFVEASPVLTDEFLMELVADCAESVRIAMAGRPTVGEPLGFRLSEYGGEDVVERLLSNCGATGSTRIYLKALDRFEGSEEVSRALAKRDDLTLRVLDKLIDRISTLAGEKLISRYGLAPSLAVYLQGQTRRAALRKAIEGASRAEIEGYLRYHNERGNLTQEVLAQLLDAGADEPFWLALSLCTEEPEEKIRDLAERGNMEALREMVAKAGLGETLEPTLLVSLNDRFGSRARQAPESQSRRAV